MGDYESEGSRMANLWFDAQKSYQAVIGGKVAIQVEVPIYRHMGLSNHHVQDFVESICDKNVFLYKGEIKLMET